MISRLDPLVTFQSQRLSSNKDELFSSSSSEEEEEEQEGLPIPYLLRNTAALEGDIFPSWRSGLLIARVFELMSRIRTYTNTSFSRPDAILLTHNKQSAVADANERQLQMQT